MSEPEPEDQVVETFQAARDAVREAAQAEYGRDFEDFGSFYLWVLAEHDAETLQRWERVRVADWVRLLREAGFTIPEKQEQQMHAAAEQAAQVMFLDHDAPRDSAFEFPTGGERRVRVAKQLDDPFSPLNGGLPNWMDID